MSRLVQIWRTPKTHVVSFGAATSSGSIFVRRKSFASNAIASDGALGSSKSFDNLSDISFANGSANSKYKFMISRTARWLSSYPCLSCCVTLQCLANSYVLFFFILSFCCVHFFRFVVLRDQWNPLFKVSKKSSKPR